MKVELEARYYGVNAAGIVARLSREDAMVERVCKQSMMKRVVWDIDAAERKFLRVREYRAKTEVAIKHIQDPSSISGTLEYSFQINANKLQHFRDLFRAMGYGEGSYQENERDHWEWVECEGDSELIAFVCSVTLDYWPGLKPILEIEVLSGTPEAIEMLEAKLCLPKRFPGDIAAIYEQEYGISREDLNKIPRLTFKDFPEILF